MALCSLETAATADFSCIPGPISTGGPIAGTPEAVGRAGVPGAAGVVCSVHCQGRVRHRRHIVLVLSAGGRGAGAILRWRVHCCKGRRIAVGGAGAGGTASTVISARGNTKGGGASHVMVTVGIEVSTPVGTAFTVVCAGANTNGGGGSHVVVGIEANTPVGTAAAGINAGASTNGSGSSHVIVASSIETSSRAGVVSTGVGAGLSAKVTKEGIGASHVIVAAGIDARSAAGTAPTVVFARANTSSLWRGGGAGAVF